MVKHWVHSVIEVTGRTLVWVGLLASVVPGILNLSIVNSAMSTNSHSWILLTNLDDTGGSPVPKVITSI